MRVRSLRDLGLRKTSTHSSADTPSSSGNDSDSLPDLDDNGSGSETGLGASLDTDNDETASDSGSETSADLENDEPTSGTEREASTDLDSDGSASAMEPRSSPTPSIRSRTRGSSRVSKTQKRGRSKGKAPA